jgi:hypothetical protein
MLPDIPNTYSEVPPGYTEKWVTNAELLAAGFHGGGEPSERKPGSAPVEELLVEGPQVISVADAATIMAAAMFPALLNPDGVIVATWDEGRWWTPEESDAFTAALVAEMQDEGGGEDA